MTSMLSSSEEAPWRLQQYGPLWGATQQEQLLQLLESPGLELRRHQSAKRSADWMPQVNMAGSIATLPGLPGNPMSGCQGCSNM